MIIQKCTGESGYKCIYKYLQIANISSYVRINKMHIYKYTSVKKCNVNSRKDSESTRCQLTRIEDNDVFIDDSHRHRYYVNFCEIFLTI